MHRKERASSADAVPLRGWFTARSWEHWVTRYESRGYNVIACSWPHVDGDIDALRRDPSAITGLRVSEIVDHYVEIISALATPPISNNRELCE